jgi:hypothetical protein
MEGYRDPDRRLDLFALIIATTNYKNLKQIIITIIIITGSASSTCFA